MDLRLQPGFLGTGASLLSDLSLLAYVLLIVPGMIIGAIFAWRGLHRPHHKWLMIWITVINWVLILFLMVASYTSDIDDNILRQPGNMRYLIPTVHGLFGLPAQLLATYVVYRMLREDTQVAAAKRRGERGRQLERYWFRSAKSTMRLTLVLWLITSGFGVLTYLVRFDVVPAFALVPLSPPAATPEVTPAATESPADALSAPVQTPEIEGTSLPPVTTPDVSPPVQTPEVRPPVVTPEADPEPDDDDEMLAPVATPDVLPPVATPDVDSDDDDEDDDDSGRGRGRGRGRGGDDDEDDDD